MCTMQRFRLNHIALLGPVFYISKLTGLLPVSYNLGPLSRKKLYFGKIPKEPFSISKFGILLSFLFLGSQLWSGYNMLEFCVTTAIEYKVTCLRGNHCVIYGIFISHVVVGVLDTLSAIVKCKRSVRCFNTAYHLLNHPNPSVSRLPLATFTIIAFIALLALRLVINQYFHAYPHPLFYYGYYFSYFVPIVSFNLVAAFALVAEKAYREVNHDLKTICDEKHQSLFNHNRLRYLAMKHDRITDFVDEISSCYGLDILLGMFDCFLQFVLFLYLAIWTLLVEGLFNSYHNWFIPYMSSFVEIFTIMFKIVYLCYRCQKTTYHGALTLSYLHRLSTRRDLCSKSHLQISVFVMQHHSRTIEITALKLFTLNMGLLFKILGIVSTYFIVLIQFQISGGKKTFTPNKKTDVCDRWPCLGG